MSDRDTIITIGRQYGSGGYEIGKKLSELLDIPFYDKELLKRASKDSGLCEEIFETYDEKPTNSFLYSLVMETYSLGYSSGTYADMPINHKIFLSQYNTIKQIADEGPCVIVGRCADYALEHYDNAIHLFIYADLDDRIRRIARIQNITDAKAKELIMKTDKKRSSYYNYYTNKDWGNAKGYDLCLNSAKLGIDGSVKAIEEYIKIRNCITTEQFVNHKI